MLSFHPLHVCFRIPEKGFPRPDDPTKRGDLVVTFDVVFPDYVDEEYHEDIKRLL